MDSGRIGAKKEGRWPTIQSRGAARRQRLAEALLGYLHAHRPPEWPGAAGITVEEVLRSYPQAVKAGRVPGVQELRRPHPELAGDLEEFLAGLAQPEDGS